MTDEWTKDLRCPNCHKTGMVSLSQGEHDRMPTIVRISDGFKVVRTEYGPNFCCEACDVAVLP